MLPTDSVAPSGTRRSAIGMYPLPQPDCCQLILPPAYEKSRVPVEPFQLMLFRLFPGDRTKSFRSVELEKVLVAFKGCTDTRYPVAPERDDVVASQLTLI